MADPLPFIRPLRVAALSIRLVAVRVSATGGTGCATAASEWALPPPANANRSPARSAVAVTSTGTPLELVELLPSSPLMPLPQAVSVPSEQSARL